MEPINLTQTPHLFGPSLALGAGLSLLLAYLIAQLFKIGSRPAGMPPGPPTRPFWGNIKEARNPPSLPSSLLPPSPPLLN